MNKKCQLLFLFITFLLLQIPAAASADTITDNLVPQDEREGTGEVEHEFNRYPTSHYQLDLYLEDAGSGWWPGNWGDHIQNDAIGLLHMLFNGAWMFNIVWIFFVMNVVEQSFTLDFVESVISVISEAVRAIAGFNNGLQDGGVWGALVLFVFVLVGTWAAYIGIVKRESSRALSGILSSFIIFVCALVFFANADRLLTMVNDASADLQNTILSSSASIVSPGNNYSHEEGIAAMKNQMYDLLIDRPYLLMQYGTSSRSEIESEQSGRVDSLLSNNPISDERADLVETEVNDFANTMMTTGGLVDRLLFLPLMGIANLLIGFMLLLISSMIIMYQILFMVLVLFAPIPLLLGMIPSMRTAASNWALKVVHAQLMKIGIALLLTILFTVSAILYQAADDSQVGYLMMMVLQILCFVGIWMKRRDIFGIISQASGGVVSSTGHSGQQLNNYRRKIQHAMNNRAMRNMLGNRNNPNPGIQKDQGMKGRLKTLKERPGIVKYTKDDLAERRKMKDAVKAKRQEKMANRPHIREFEEGQEMGQAISDRQQEEQNQAQTLGVHPSHFHGMNKQERKQEMERLKSRKDFEQQAMDYSKRQSPNEATAGQNQMAATKDYQRKPSGLSTAKLAERGNAISPKDDMPSADIPQTSKERIYQAPDAPAKKEKSVLKQRQPVEQDTKTEISQNVKRREIQNVHANETKERFTKEERHFQTTDRKEQISKVTNRHETEQIDKENNEKKLLKRRDISNEEIRTDQRNLNERRNNREEIKRDRNGRRE